MRRLQDRTKLFKERMEKKIPFEVQPNPWKHCGGWLYRTWVFFFESRVVQRALYRELYFTECDKQHKAKHVEALLKRVIELEEDVSSGTVGRPIVHDDDTWYHKSYLVKPTQIVGPAEV